MKMSRRNEHLIALLLFFMLHPVATIFLPRFHGLSPKFGRLLSLSNGFFSADGDKHELLTTMSEDGNRRRLLATFVINAVPLFVVPGVARSETDEFEEFGKSLSKATGGYPYTPSPIPPKSSSALDLSSSSSNDGEREMAIDLQKQYENFNGSQSKTLDEVINDAKKLRKSQIGPLSHGY